MFLNYETLMLKVWFTSCTLIITGLNINIHKKLELRNYLKVGVQLRRFTAFLFIVCELFQFVLRVKLMSHQVVTTS
jgi:hypothetical protein